MNPEDFYKPDTYLEPTEIDVLDFEEYYGRSPLNDDEVFEFLEMRAEDAQISESEELAIQDLQQEEE